MRLSRPKSRPRVLFIDQFVPTPDKDSGSNDIYWFMRIFLQLGYEVTFVPAAMPDPADRYIDELRQLGIICPVAPEFAAARRLARGVMARPSIWLSSIAFRSRTIFSRC